MRCIRNLYIYIYILCTEIKYQYILGIQGVAVKGIIKPEFFGGLELKHVFNYIFI